MQLQVAKLGTYSNYWIEGGAVLKSNSRAAQTASKLSFTVPSETKISLSFLFPHPHQPWPTLKIEQSIVQVSVLAVQGLVPAVVPAPSSSSQVRHLPTIPGLMTRMIYLTRPKSMRHILLHTYHPSRYSLNTIGPWPTTLESMRACQYWLLVCFGPFPLINQFNDSQLHTYSAKDADYHRGLQGNFGKGSERKRSSCRKSRRSICVVPCSQTGLKPMIPTYVFGWPSGNETGDFLAVDLGRDPHFTVHSSLLRLWRIRWYQLACLSRHT